MEDISPMGRKKTISTPHRKKEKIYLPWAEKRRYVPLTRKM
jgi:hypothetical protein